MLYPIQNNTRNKLDISGIWDFRIDPDGVGEAEGWANGLAASRPIAVPGSWNEQYEDLFGYLDLAWYVTTVTVPSSWQGQRIFIRVGSACYYGTVYVNGVKVVGPRNLASDLPGHASQLYAKNLENLLGLMITDEGALELNFEDDIIDAACIAREGELRGERTAK